MQYNWKNKAVIITGSGIGIGWQLAMELAKAGAKVVLNARNNDRIIQRTNELNEKGYLVTFYSGDISEVKTCNALVDHCINVFGQLDVLINNAGISAEPMTIDKINPEVFTYLVKVNFLASFYMTQAALPYLKKTKGSVLFISSLAGIHGLGNYSAYCSSKMALTAFSESLRKELHKDNIYVGIAYLGFTENDKEKQIMLNNGDKRPQPRRKNLKVTPAKVVVKKIIYMIERRKKVMVLSPIGKLLATLNRISPLLTNKLLLILYRKEEQLKD